MCAFAPSSEGAFALLLGGKQNKYLMVGVWGFVL